jgi:hypothetical protein
MLHLLNLCMLLRWYEIHMFDLNLTLELRSFYTKNLRVGMLQGFDYYFVLCLKRFLGSDKTNDAHCILFAVSAYRVCVIQNFLLHYCVVLRPCERATAGIGKEN